MRLPSLFPVQWLVLLAALSSWWVQANPSLKQPGLHSRATGPITKNIAVRTAPSNEAELTDPAKPLPSRHCDPDYPQHPKTLLVSRLANPGATQASRQGLLGIEQALPRQLGRDLVSQGAVTLFYKIDRELYPRQGHVEPVRRAALQADAQLVLSGKLISTSGLDHSRGLITAGRDALVAGLRLPPDWDSRQRQFMLELRLHHGITGNLLWQRTYHTQGAWRAGQAPRSGKFQSPAFRQSHYGARVEALVEKALSELTQVIRCQPLVGWLSDRGPGTQPLLALGQRQGLNTDDELMVYRLRQEPIPNRYRRYRFLLSDSGYRVRIRELHAHQSVVEWLSPGARPGRYLVVVPAAQKRPQASVGGPASDED